MARPHKDTNRLPLLATLVTNLLIYYALVSGVDLSQITTNLALAHAGALLPGGLAASLCGIINAQLPPIAKARLIFFQWKYPLPGSRAFSKYAHEDPRIDIAAVQARWAPLPADPREQNALWYRIYQQEQDSLAVSQLNRNWLFTRDYACIVALLMPLLGIAGIIQTSEEKLYFAMIGLLFLQFFLARQAAKNNSEQLVATVLAQACTKPL